MSEQTLGTLTAAVTVLTAGFGVVSLAKPRLLTGEDPTPGQKYYARMYAARAIPLAIGVLAGMRGGRRPRGLLWVAAAAQAADSAIGVARRNPGQIFPPAAGAILYAVQATR